MATPTMVVLVNGRPQQGRLEMRKNEFGNYVIVSADMAPWEEAPTVPASGETSGNTLS